MILNAREDNLCEFGMQWETLVFLIKEVVLLDLFFRIIIWDVVHKTEIMIVNGGETDYEAIELGMEKL